LSPDSLGSAFPSVALLTWYAQFGRAQLPWRTTRDPYRIVVSETMLAQTQVERVIPLYTAFLARFADFAALASADLGDVVRAWRGLGYNSRAARLHALARVVVDRYDGRLPSGRDELLALPGIGAYTVAAIRAFAFDCDDAAVDVNIRRVVHRVLLGLEHPARATTGELDALARSAVPPGKGHDWNSAMMDLGATVCTARAPKCLVCPLRDACAAAPIDVASLAAQARAHAKPRPPQSALPFEQTTRFLRGRIIDRLRDVPSRETVLESALTDDLRAIVPPERCAEIPAIVETLVRDGLVTRVGNAVRLS
jgi:A/G-specific adenine glycosylase